MLYALSQVQLAQLCCIYVHDSRWLDLIKLHNSSYIKFGNSWENYFLKHSKNYNRKSSSMLMINLLTHMFVGLLTENNIKKGGPLMWIESHLSTIKSHPDFLWPDVGNVCRHRGEQYKLLIIWYKSINTISDTKIARFYCCWCELMIRRSDNCQYRWIYFPVLGTTTVTSSLISKGKSKTRLHCCRC